MIDSHLHLDDERLIGQVEQIVAEFDTRGIDFVINNSADLAGMIASYKLANTYEKVFATVGMHPHTAKDFDANFVHLMKEYAKNPKVVAVGEIGLDYYYDLSERQIQRDVFAEQIEIADQLGLPITLHIRDAYGDAMDVLNAQKKYLNNNVLWHCYSGSAEFAKQCAKLGHYFAFWWRDNL
ncbi:MAG: TatD family hydrolase [Clostridia bacterium]|nr:TatD family hydrolase [Clostridia bacterium]